MSEGTICPDPEWMGGFVAAPGRFGSALLLFALAACAGRSLGPPSGSQPVASDPKLDALLEDVQRTTGVPGLAAAVVDRSAVIAIAAVGRRRVDEPDRLLISDKFHLGSDTKAMTALLCALFVERGLLRWEMTLSEAFPEWASSMNEAYRGVRLMDLLRHRAGMPALTSAADLALLQGIDEERDPIVTQRLTLARNVLHRPPAVTPGTRWVYSNAGYVVAGAVLEKHSGKPWEDLMHQEIFGPLKMDSCGFGPPATGATRGQPFGHRSEAGGYVPTDEDNSALLGPAGTVHCSLADWASFIRANMEPSPVPLVKPATLELLHQPFPMDPPKPDADGYAMGWGSAERAWGGGQVLAHDGSNGRFRARARLAVKRGLAFLIATNAGDDRAENALTQTYDALVARYGSAQAEH